MKYVITQNKMMKLVGSLVQEVYPKFNKEKALHMTWSNGDESYEEFYDPEIQGRKGIFAKYWIWKEELELNPELFKTLESFFGDDMTFVIDWFNNDAESITF
jgi:hypothetical protein